MNSTQKQQANQTAYRQLSAAINRDYPRGRLVAIAGGQIVADAADFDELRATLQSLGKDPAQTLVVEAGVEYPESAVIFL
jgi:hypothetical protein